MHRVWSQVITADMRSPAGVLDHPDTRQLIDFDQPVGVLLIAMAHFLTDEERAGVMKALRDGLPAGSYLALTHVTTDDKPFAAIEDVVRVYQDTPTPIFFRPHDEIRRLLDGFDLVEPGLVTIDRWRPDPADPAPPATGWLKGAVGRKP